MKPLLSRKVRRGRVLNEWESAAHQSTMDGLKAFERRQQDRLALAQPGPKPDLSNVEALPTSRKSRRA